MVFKDNKADWVFWSSSIYVVDGKEVGCIQSKLLCRSLFDLYIGDDPFDTKAKEDVKFGIVSILQD